MRILVATDGSKHASGGVEWLLHFPLPSDSAVEVVSAVQPPFPGETTAWIRWSELKEQSEQVVADARERLATRWTTVSGRTVEGEPRQAIIEAANRTGSELVVLGARGIRAHHARQRVGVSVTPRPLSGAYRAAASLRWRSFSGAATRA